MKPRLQYLVDSREGIYESPNHFSYLTEMREQNQLCDVIIEVERYDPQRDCWTTVTPLQNKRLGAGATILNGKIFICGGRGESTYNTVEVFDPVLNKWVFVAPMKKARYRPLVVTHAGKILAFGGQNENMGNLSSVEVYDSDKDSWSYVFKMPKLTGDIFGGILLV